MSMRFHTVGLHRLAPLGAALLAISGCGPIISTSLIIDAEAKLSAAKAAEAERYAPYEWTAAEEYLHKAHEELGYADYGPAIDYAYKAADAAEKGTRKASDERSKDMEGPPTVVDDNAASAAEPTAQPVTIKRIDIKAPQ
jgi:hypothetical protein